MARFGLLLAILLGWAALAAADDSSTSTSVERGRTALLTRAFNPAGWSLAAYDTTWKHWGTDPKAPPQDYAQAFRDRYGLHPAPYENGKLPMGLREGRGLLGKGLATDCLLCHGGSVLGNSYVGLGNSSLDIQALFEELGKASGTSGKTPFVFSNVRGTSEAGTFAVFLLSYRNPDLTLRLKPLDLDLRHDLCEDVPAWWLLKKKKTMYHTGASDARSVRSIMQFMLTPLNSRDTFEKEEPTFRDIRAYMVSLEAPKYPFPIDHDLAAHGEKLFRATCSTCHGTYGSNWTYPSKIVPIDVVGTDPSRFVGISKAWADYYNKSWFGREKGDEGYMAKATAGYQAPPLDGVWATAPYLHNGSVPTLYHMLNSKSRPKIFTRSFRTDAQAFDRDKVGWKVQVLDRGPDVDVPAHERRKVYNTTQRGRGNQGHTFGDDLTDDQRRAVIEYLKTL
jgi:mono/diheme cytochrome c family protein